MKKKLLKGVGPCPDAVLDSMHLCMQASPSASYPIQRTALPCTHLLKEKKSSFRGRKKGKAQKKTIQTRILYEFLYDFYYFHLSKITNNMLLPNREITKEERQQHVNHVYDIVGYAMDVCKQLPCSLPEYIYQEAFATVLKSHGIDPHKELRYYPIFNGVEMQSYLKMDFMVECEGGNIIVEAKALEELTKKERAQLFGYMVGTGFPYGLLVNFANYPKPRIERYFFDKETMTLVAF